MYTSSGRLQLQGKSAVKKDPGVVAIDLVNNYLKASSEQKKSELAGLLSQHLSNELHEGNNDWTMSIGKGNLPERFHNWQGDETQKMQDFKTYIYRTYYNEKQKKLICAALQEVTNNLLNVQSFSQLNDIEMFYRQDVVTLLLLLLNKLPCRKNKINILIGYVQQPGSDVQMLTNVIGEICTAEKSAGENAYDILNDQILSKEAKLSRLKELLSSELKAEQFRKELSFLLWLQDVQVLLDAYNVLKEVDPWRRPLDDTYNTKVISPLLKHLEKNASNVITGFVKDKISNEAVFHYFSLDIKALNNFDRFLWRNFRAKLFVADEKKDNDYFKKFDKFLSKLREAGKIPQADRYKKILDEQAILAIANSITSEPATEQTNYFDDTDDLKLYRELHDRVHTLNSTMYEVAPRKKNIKRLGLILNRVHHLGEPKSDGEAGVTLLKQSRILVCIVKVEYLQQILKLWQAFDEETPIEPSSFAITILCIRAYVDCLNSTDIEIIKKLIENQKFKDFITTGFYTLSDGDQTTVLESCRKIREKVSDKIPNFPVPQMQRPQAAVAVTPIQSVSQPQVVGFPVEGVEVPVLQPNIPQLRAAQPPVVAPRLAAPVALAGQPAPQGNEPPQRSFMQVVSASWNEFTTAVWAGFSRIWRTLFGG